MWSVLLALAAKIQQVADDAETGAEEERDVGPAADGPQFAQDEARGEE
jgi:hypothetical protein